MALDRDRLQAGEGGYQNLRLARTAPSRIDQSVWKAAEWSSLVMGIVPAAVARDDDLQQVQQNPGTAACLSSCFRYNRNQQVVWGPQPLALL